MVPARRSFLTNNHSLLALSFFLILFLLFAFFKPALTGQAVSITQPTVTTQLADQPFQGTLTLTLENADDLSSTSELHLRVYNTSISYGFTNTTLVTSIPGLIYNQAGTYTLNLAHFGLTIPEPGNYYFSINITDGTTQKAFSSTTFQGEGFTEVYFVTEQGVYSF